MEIERKFLVKGEFKNLAFKKIKIRQGYLSSAPERTVRVRVSGDKGYITIKGMGNATGVNRFEWEKEISVPEAEQLLKICEPGIISKIRYLVKSDRHTFEVDEFLDHNEGLVIAELELETEDETYSVPEWLGVEVTGDRKYYNAYLVKHPYKTW